MGHWEVLGGHPGNMGPKRKRKGQYSIYADYREPGRWRKKMDKGRGPGKQRGLTIEEILRNLIMEEVGSLSDGLIHCPCGVNHQQYGSRRDLESWTIVHKGEGIGNREVWDLGRGKGVGNTFLCCLRCGRVITANSPFTVVDTIPDVASWFAD